MLIVEKFILCDRCCERFAVDDRASYKNYKEIQRAAEINGWLCSSKKDLCEGCKPNQ